MTEPPRASIREIPRRRAAPSGSVPNRPRRVVPGGSPRALLREERQSFGYAFQGVAYAWRTQRHLRIHAAVALCAIGAGLFFWITPAEWAILVAMIALVSALELLNTVIEVVVDLVSPEYHPQAKVAKDVAAGAVLLAALGAVAVGVLLFGPRLIALFRS